MKNKHNEFPSDIFLILETVKATIVIGKYIELISLKCTVSYTKIEYLNNPYSCTVHASQVLHLLVKFRGFEQSTPFLTMKVSQTMFLLIFKIKLTIDFDQTV